MRKLTLYSAMGNRNMKHPLAQAFACAFISTGASLSVAVSAAAEVSFILQSAAADCFVTIPFYCSILFASIKPSFNEGFNNR